VHFVQPDLSLMRDTDRLADDILARMAKLHPLVVCAGVVRGRRLVSSEGRIELRDQLSQPIRADWPPAAVVAGSRCAG
jgi:hypothetical protein